MRKTFIEWIKVCRSNSNLKTGIPCVLLDLSGVVVGKFERLIDLAEFLGMPQVTVYNTDRIFLGKYRVFTQDYFLKNKDVVYSMKNYIRECDYISEMHKKQNIIICDLFPNEEFLYYGSIAKKLNVSQASISNIMTGKTISNPHNIRYKHPELRGLDFRQKRNK